MGKWNGKSLPARAEAALKEAPLDPKKLMLLHTGVALGVSLAIAVLNLFLDRQIDTTGGLSGLGLRSILATAQSVLETLGNLALPFWETGIFAAAFLWATRQPAENSVLLLGFRRFGPVLRMRILQGFILILASVVVIQFSSTIYMMTPWANTAMLQLTTILGTDTDPIVAIDSLSPEMMQQLLAAVRPLLIIGGVLLAVVAIPLLYRMRFAPYLQMQQERMGARASIAESFRMTRRNWIALLKLDLQFWWFYVLQILTIALCYGDVILSLCGIAQPWSDMVGFFLFYVLGIAGQLALFTWARPKVITSYAIACRELQGYSV
ncbi:MAG: hypothetical protein IJB47_02645 [Oscillospiraceae bacterium]|nr:hypothetical protein [Oscillospiraceae bacterium]